jgi:hypothetical protein
MSRAKPITRHVGGIQKSRATLVFVPTRRKTPDHCSRLSRKLAGRALFLSRKSPARSDRRAARLACARVSRAQRLVERRATLFVALQVRAPPPQGACCGIPFLVRRDLSTSPSIHTVRCSRSIQVFLPVPRRVQRARSSSRFSHLLRKWSVGRRSHRHRSAPHSDR